MKESNSFLQLLINEISWSYTKSSGPGGQHVNTSDTKAILHWDFKTSTNLNDKQKRLIKKNLSRFVSSKKGIFTLSSSKFRSREANKKYCLTTFEKLIKSKAFFESKKRRASRPTKASIERRLKNKKNRGDIKKMRAKVT